jgi:hypothetical protein
LPRNSFLEDQQRPFPGYCAGQTTVIESVPIPGAADATLRQAEATSTQIPLLLPTPAGDQEVLLPTSSFPRDHPSAFPGQFNGHPTGASDFVSVPRAAESLDSSWHLMDSAEVECKIRQFAAEALQIAPAQSVAPSGGVSRAPGTESPKEGVEYEPLAPAQSVDSLELEEFFRALAPSLPTEGDTSVGFGTFAPAQEGILSGGVFSWTPFPYPLSEEAGDGVVNLGTFAPSQNVTLAPWANFMRDRPVPSESPMQGRDVNGAGPAFSALSPTRAASERSAVRKSSSVGSRYGGGLRRVESAPALLEVGREEKSKGAVRFDQKEDSRVKGPEEDVKVVQQGDIQGREAAEESPKAAPSKTVERLPQIAAACEIEEILPSAQATTAEPSMLRIRRQEARFAAAEGPRFGNNGYFSLKPAVSAAPSKPTIAKAVTTQTNRRTESKRNPQTSPQANPSPVETTAQFPGESNRAPALSFVEDEFARQRALFAAANLRNGGPGHVPAPRRPWTGPGFVAVLAKVGAFVAGAASWV